MPIRFRPSRLILLPAVAAALLLAACGSKITPENFDRITTGMTRDQVHAILGKPDRVASEDIGGLMKLTKDSWTGRAGTLTVTYSNDTVALSSLEPRDTTKP
jgi:hypothetical protein